ncbi:MAG: CPBP family intramembrane glutamic endopeptidase [Chloroflexota bacterium]|nr:CPBP family intramembrane glutamic endopeptidase [Chloroflexota bacterium]
MKTARRHPLDPRLLFSIFVAIGVGTVLLDQSPRLALLWTSLLAMSIYYRGHREVPADFTLRNIGRGALLGAIISVPLLVFLSEQLRTFTERLYAARDPVLLFYQVCLVSAPIEEYFFRGIVQSRLGSSLSIGLYALVPLLYFLPHAPVLVAFIVFVVMGALGIVYAYVRDRYGLAASIACHVMVGFVLQVMPSLIASLRLALS